jgi:hypothetical protein
MRVRAVGARVFRAERRDTGPAPGPGLTVGATLRLGAGLVILAALVVCLNAFCSAMRNYLETHAGPWYWEWGDLALVALVALYALLLAVPFVPGVELGWAIMMWFGAKGTLAVYVATVLALTMSFAIGRLIPIRWVAALLHALRLQRAERLALRIADAAPGERLGVLLGAGPARPVPFLLRFRYSLLAVLFNLPGNWLIGGGGGIGLLAGVSGAYPAVGYALLVAIAVAPVPLFFLANHWFLTP